MGSVSGAVPCSVVHDLAASRRCGCHPVHPGQRREHDRHDLRDSHGPDAHCAAYSFGAHRTVRGTAWSAVACFSMAAAYVTPALAFGWSVATIAVCGAACLVLVVWNWTSVPEAFQSAPG